jgi:hypothetical protein
MRLVDEVALELQFSANSQSTIAQYSCIPLPNQAAHYHMLHLSPGSWLIAGRGSVSYCAPLMAIELLIEIYSFHGFFIS